MAQKGTQTTGIPSSQPGTPMAISDSQNTLCCCDGSISNYSNPVLPRHAPMWGLSHEVTLESTCPFLYPVVPASDWSQGEMKVIIGCKYESTKH